MATVASLGRLAKRWGATATLWRLRARPILAIVHLGIPVALVPPSVPAVRRQTHTHGRGHERALAAAAAECWKCRAPLAEGNRLVCGACGVGQPVPPGTNYFDIFGYVSMNLTPAEKARLTKLFSAFC